MTWGLEAEEGSGTGVLTKHQGAKEGPWLAGFLRFSMLRGKTSIRVWGKPNVFLEVYGERVVIL
jgi:hypothetical protein